MNKRYKVNSEWEADKIVGPCLIETADLLDTRSGHVYREGAYRVKMLRKVEGFRGKTFYGESAWSNADRLAMDAQMAERYRGSN